MQMHLSETDASLLSWLHALPIDTFSCPFEEKPLKLGMDRFVKPNLEATWADAILATPIKPQQLFPYNAVPTGRSRNTELMSRSLVICCLPERALKLMSRAARSPEIVKNNPKRPFFAQQNDCPALHDAAMRN